MKRQKGITLIALVITIIVLLILAGVSISMISGDDGIATQAGNARTNTKAAQIEEAIELAAANNQMAMYSGEEIKDIADVAEELLDEGLITEEEKEEIIDSKQLVVDGKTIDFEVIESVVVSEPTGEVIQQNDLVRIMTLTNGTNPDNYATSHGYYPIAVSGMVEGTEITGMTFYIKENGADDSTYQLATVRHPVSGSNIPGDAINNPISGNMGSSYTFVGFQLADLETSYTLKVEFACADGNIRYAEINTPEGLCFVEGTEVLTETGLVNIEDIKPGMKVYSYNEVADRAELKEVLSVSENYTQEEIYSVYVDGEVIESTDVHPYYVKDKGYVAAKELKAGDVLVDVEGNEIIIERIEVSVSETEISVYNFEVEDNHNYYVSENSVLVHNAGCPTDPF